MESCGLEGVFLTVRPPVVNKPARNARTLRTPADPPIPHAETAGAKAEQEATVCLHAGAAGSAAWDSACNGHIHHHLVKKKLSKTVPGLRARAHTLPAAASGHRLPPPQLGPSLPLLSHGDMGSVLPAARGVPMVAASAWALLALSIRG